MPSTRGRRGITVVIPFRGESYLWRLCNCLRALTKQTRSPTEIIVSEQDSAALAAGICEEVGATHLVTAALPMFNKSAAINSGLRHSQTYHVYVLDADVILSPFALEEIHPRVSKGSFVMLDARRASGARPGMSWDDVANTAWEADWARTCTGLLNATTRTTWFQLCGYDERFVGWGSEDSYVAWKAESLFRLRMGWVAGIGVHQEHAGEPAYRAEAGANKALMEKLKRKNLPRAWGQAPVLSVVRRAPKQVGSGSVKICVLITTFNRPNMLLDLLQDIETESGSNLVHVIILDDGSDQDYAGPRAYAQARGWDYTRVPRHGKEKYWELTGKLFAAASRIKARYYIQLPDDVRLCTNFFDVLLSYWRAIPDDKKVALNPLRDALRLDVGCWSGITPRKGREVDQVGWVDMCYVAEREFFDLLNWKMEPIVGRPNHLGSGVGQQVTSRLLKAGRSFYRTGKSLVVHVVAESRMNTLTRLEESMRVADFIDGDDRARQLEVRGALSASLASIPSREALLQRTVESLLPQVDRLNVYLNEYEAVPPFLHNPKITVARSQDHGDLGDAGKFWWCEEVNGFHLTCDDDLLYPPDYVDKLLMHVELYGRRAVVSAHGARLHDKIVRYYSSRTVFPCLGAVSAAEAVHVVGTGAMAYHTSAIRLTRDMFKLPNMADVWVALAGQDQQVPFVCVPHKAGWIQYQTPPTTIYADHKNRDTEQTQLILAASPWSLYKV